MFALLGIIIGLIIIYIISIYEPRTITSYQIRYLFTATIVYIIVFGFIQNSLIGNKTPIQILLDNSLFIPLGFFILWYYIVSLLSNLVGGGTEEKDYRGFFENRNTQMSERRIYN